MNLNQWAEIVHVTESVCPVCLAKIPACHVLVGEDIYLKKTCAQHGGFSTIIWRGKSKPDYFSWRKDKVWTHPDQCLTEVNQGCPYDCGLCPEHRQKTCCVLLEVTERCNLNCNFCFANSGRDILDPSIELIRAWLNHLAAAGKPFIHLSGGEPTVRNDLPEIITMAKEMEFSYIQLNTNGLRLAQDPGYAKTLKEAGLSSVFLQFDGTKEQIYQKLRGRNLLSIKENAIKNCGINELGVILVPTIVPGVNHDNIGEIVDFGLSHMPDVRGIHFQPVSYFGRYPEPPLDKERITLPEIIREIENQTKGDFKVDYFAPSGCDHARCGFHGDFVLMADGTMKNLTPAHNQNCCSSPPNSKSAVERNRDFVARRWVRNRIQRDQDQSGLDYKMDEWDQFIERIKSHSFTITGMAFQDCWNIDLERLGECSLHVLSPDGRIIPFCAYNLSSTEGRSLYRGHVQESYFLTNDRKIEGCLICGKKLVYGKSSSLEVCTICGKAQETYIKCIDGHYICSLCHGMDILDKVERILSESKEINPLVLIERIFELPELNIHGPEYHSIVPAVLVTAFQNLSGKKDRAKINETIKRGKYLTGGSCGYYGVCGACVGAGMAIAMIEDVTPMSIDKRALANTVTGLALLAISKHRGPRCCKREAITSIRSFMKNTAYFTALPDKKYICQQYEKNQDCIYEECPYYPKKQKNRRI